MFGDIGWSELLLIGIVALIVIGPEDLPDMFRQLGRFTAKIRAMGREFSRAMEQAAKDSGVNDVAKDLKAATSAKSMGLDKVKEAADRFEKWDPIKNAAKPTAPVKPVATPVVENTIIQPAVVPAHVMTPAPQAVAEDMAIKAVVPKAAAAKPKAVAAGPVVAAKPRAKAVKAAEAAAPVAPKPRAPRKTIKADEA